MDESSELLAMTMEQQQVDQDRFIENGLIEKMLQETFEFENADAVSQLSKDLSIHEKPISVIVKIGSTHISQEKFNRLREGSLIPLDQLSGDSMICHAENQTFQGKLGSMHGKYAFKIEKQ